VTNALEAEEGGVEEGEVLARVVEVDADELCGDLELHQREPGGTQGSRAGDLLDEAVELRGLEGLLHVTARAHLEAADRVLFLALGGDDDDGMSL